MSKTQEVRETTYKMRCELYPDSLKFLTKYMKATSCDLLDVKIEAKNMMGGCTVEMTTHKSIEFVRQVLDSISDLHVMSESLELLENYTGERV